jgi:hypothetical protein
MVNRSGEIMSLPIFISQGKTRYVGGTITDELGHDISGDTYTVALGLSNAIPPTGGWVAPDVNTVGSGGTSSRQLLQLVTATTTLGTGTVTPGTTVWSWGNIVDTPEIEPFVLSGPHVLA